MKNLISEQCNGSKDSLKMSADGSGDFDKVIAVDKLNENYHQSYQDFFPNLFATFKIDFIAVSIISLVFFIGIYWSLKSKDSIKIN